MGLLRNLFWAGILMLILALAPDFGILGPAADKGREKAGLQDLLYVISATVSDVGDICDRRPEVCEKLERIGEQFRNRAVRITGAAHDWLIGADDRRDVPVHADLPAQDNGETSPEEAAGAAYRLAETPPEQEP